MFTNYSFHNLIGETLDAGSGSGDHARRYKTVLGVFRPLKALEIRCLSVAEHSFWPASTYTDDQGQGEDIQLFLSCATDLRHLKLEYGYACEETFVDLGHFHLRFSLSPFLSSKQVAYPSLHTLHLEGLLPGQYLARFLSLHAGSLRRLQVYNAISDDWEVVWATIARDLKLDYVDIIDVYSAANKPVDIDDPNGESYVEGLTHFGFEHPDGKKKPPWM